MAAKKEKIFHLLSFLMISMYLRTAAAINIDCSGKPFHCINSTHFMICVDLGDGVSKTVDDFVIQCPPPTVCRRSNKFECEYQLPTTTESIIRPGDVTNEFEINPQTSIVTPLESNVTELFTEYQSTELVTPQSELLNVLHSQVPSHALDVTVESFNVNDTLSLSENNFAVTTEIYGVEDLSANSSDSRGLLKLLKKGKLLKEHSELPISIKSEKVRTELSIEATRANNDTNKIENLRNSDMTINIETVNKDETTYNKSNNFILHDDLVSRANKDSPNVKDDTINADNINFTILPTVPLFDLLTSATGTDSLYKINKLQGSTTTTMNIQGINTDTNTETTNIDQNLISEDASTDVVISTTESNFKTTSEVERSNTTKTTLSSEIILQGISTESTYTIQTNLENGTILPDFSKTNMAEELGTKRTSDIYTLSLQDYSIPEVNFSERTSITNMDTVDVLFNSTFSESLSSILEPTINSTEHAFIKNTEKTIISSNQESSILLSQSKVVTDTTLNMDMTTKETNPTTPTSAPNFVKVKEHMSSTMNIELDETHLFRQTPYGVSTEDNYMHEINKVTTFEPAATEIVTGINNITLQDQNITDATTTLPISFFSTYEPIMNSTESVANSKETIESISVGNNNKNYLFQPSMDVSTMLPNWNIVAHSTNHVEQLTEIEREPISKNTTIDENYSSKNIEMEVTTKNSYTNDATKIKPVTRTPTYPWENIEDAITTEKNTERNMLQSQDNYITEVIFESSTAFPVEPVSTMQSTIRYTEMGTRARETIGEIIYSVQSNLDDSTSIPDITSVTKTIYGINKMNKFESTTSDTTIDKKYLTKEVQMGLTTENSYIDELTTVKNVTFSPKYLSDNVTVANLSKQITEINISPQDNNITELNYSYSIPMTNDIYLLNNSTAFSVDPEGTSQSTIEFTEVLTSSKESDNTLLNTRHEITDTVQSKLDESINLYDLTTTGQITKYGDKLYTTNEYESTSSNTMIDENLSKHMQIEITTENSYIDEVTRIKNMTRTQKFQPDIVTQSIISKQRIEINISSQDENVTEQNNSYSTPITNLNDINLLDSSTAFSVESVSTMKPIIEFTEVVSNPKETTESTSVNTRREKIYLLQSNIDNSTSISDLITVAQNTVYGAPLNKIKKFESTNADAIIDEKYLSKQMQMEVTTENSYIDELKRIKNVTIPPNNPTENLKQEIISKKIIKTNISSQDNNTTEMNYSNNTPITNLDDINLFGSSTAFSADPVNTTLLTIEFTDIVTNPKETSESISFNTMNEIMSSVQPNNDNLTSLSYLTTIDQMSMYEEQVNTTKKYELHRSNTTVDESNFSKKAEMEVTTENPYIDGLARIKNVLITPKYPTDSVTQGIIPKEITQANLYNNNTIEANYPYSTPMTNTNDINLLLNTTFSLDPLSTLQSTIKSSEIATSTEKTTKSTTVNSSHDIMFSTPSYADYSSRLPYLYNDAKTSNHEELLTIMETSETANTNGIDETYLLKQTHMEVFTDNSYVDDITGVKTVINRSKYTTKIKTEAGTTEKIIKINMIPSQDDTITEAKLLSNSLISVDPTVSADPLTTLKPSIKSTPVITSTNKIKENSDNARDEKIYLEQSTVHYSTSLPNLSTAEQTTNYIINGTFEPFNKNTKIDESHLSAQMPLTTLKPSIKSTPVITSTNKIKENSDNARDEKIYLEQSTVHYSTSLPNLSTAEQTTNYIINGTFEPFNKNTKIDESHLSAQMLQEKNTKNTYFDENIKTTNGTTKSKYPTKNITEAIIKEQNNNLLEINMVPSQELHRREVNISYVPSTGPPMTNLNNIIKNISVKKKSSEPSSATSEPIMTYTKDVNIQTREQALGNTVENKKSILLLSDMDVTTKEPNYNTMGSTQSLNFSIKVDEMHSLNQILQELSTEDYNGNQHLSKAPVRPVINMAKEIVLENTNSTIASYDQNIVDQNVFFSDNSSTTFSVPLFITSEVLTKSAKDVLNVQETTKSFTINTNLTDFNFEVPNLVTSSPASSYETMKISESHIYSPIGTTEVTIKSTEDTANIKYTESAFAVDARSQNFLLRGTETDAFTVEPNLGHTTNHETIERLLIPSNSIGEINLLNKTKLLDLSKRNKTEKVMMDNTTKNYMFPLQGQNLSDVTFLDDTITTSLNATLLNNPIFSITPRTTSELIVKSTEDIPSTKAVTDSFLVRTTNDNKNFFLFQRNIPTKPPDIEATSRVSNQISSTQSMMSLEDSSVVYSNIGDNKTHMAKQISQGVKIEIYHTNYTLPIKSPIIMPVYTIRNITQDKLRETITGTKLEPSEEPIHNVQNVTTPIDTFTLNRKNLLINKILNVSSNILDPAAKSLQDSGAIKAETESIVINKRDDKKIFPTLFEVANNFPQNISDNVTVYDLGTNATDDVRKKSQLKKIVNDSDTQIYNANQNSFKNEYLIKDINILRDIVMKNHSTLRKAINITNKPISLVNSIKNYSETELNITHQMNQTEINGALNNSTLYGTGVIGTKDKNILVKKEMPLTPFSEKHKQWLQHNMIANKRGNQSIPNSGFTCKNRIRGRYADINDCRKFYICVGKISPVLGECPYTTVFSEIKKQCTKNLSHCTRNNQFHCIQEGRFSDMLKGNVYYVCIKNKNAYVRFQFQCQNGYHLNKTIVRCVKEKQSQSQTSSTSDSDSNKANDQSTGERRSKEKKQTEVNTPTNVCKKEGKFPDPGDCRRYYVCSKNSKSEFRRRIKKCDSDEVFHQEKKKCVDSDSYECKS